MKLYLQHCCTVISTTHDENRRTFLRATAVAVTVGTTSTLRTQTAVVIPPAFTTLAVQKPLSFGPAAIDGLSEHLLRTGSVVLHEYYFDNIGPTARDGELDAALSSAFGSVAGLEREFPRIGAGLGGGSGWVMLGWNRHLQLLENYWMWDHMHAPAAMEPLLVMDMYEHSYAIDYGVA